MLLCRLLSIVQSLITACWCLRLQAAQQGYASLTTTSPQAVAGARPGPKHWATAPSVRVPKAARPSLPAVNVAGAGVCAVLRGPGSCRF